MGFSRRVIIKDGENVGGAIIKIDGNHGELEILFVSPEKHSKGVGYAAWCEIEKLHPEVDVWETVTPYFEKRNIHFYVNRCGFHVVEFYNNHHPDPNDTYEEQDKDDQFPDGMFSYGAGTKSLRRTCLVNTQYIFLIHLRCAIPIMRTIIEDCHLVQIML